MTTSKISIQKHPHTQRRYSKVVEGFPRGVEATGSKVVLFVASATHVYEIHLPAAQVELAHQMLANMKAQNDGQNP